MQRTHEGEVISTLPGALGQPPRKVPQDGEADKAKAPGGAELGAREMSLEPERYAWCLQPIAPPEGPQTPQIQCPRHDPILMLYSLAPLAVTTSPDITQAKIPCPVLTPHVKLLRPADSNY